jgi:hypothetical protein
VLNVATPLTAVTPADACVPPSVPPPEIATDTEAVEFATRFPYASSTRTTGCVDNTAPDTPATGSVTTSNRDGSPYPTLTLPLVFEVSGDEPALSVAEMLCVPLVPSVTGKDRVPDAKAAADGSVARASLDVSPTVGVAVDTRFQ